MRAGDFVGAKIYRKPTEDKRTKKCAGDKAESLTHDHSSPAGTSVPTV